MQSSCVNNVKVDCTFLAKLWNFEKYFLISKPVYNYIYPPPLRVDGKCGFWVNSTPTFHVGVLIWVWGCKFWATPTAKVGGNRLFPHQKGKRGIF